MDIEIKTKFSANIELIAYKHKRESYETLKTHDCDINDWYSDEICDTISLSEKIAPHLQEGKEYKITITIEQND